MRAWRLQDGESKLDSPLPVAANAAWQPCTGKRTRQLDSPEPAEAALYTRSHLNADASSFCSYNMHPWSQPQLGAWQRKTAAGMLHPCLGRTSVREFICRHSARGSLALLDVHAVMPPTSTLACVGTQSRVLSHPWLRGRMSSQARATTAGNHTASGQHTMRTQQPLCCPDIPPALQCPTVQGGRKRGLDVGAACTPL